MSVFADYCPAYWIYNVRCMRCKNVKPRCAFKGNNRKVIQENVFLPNLSRLVPVCNKCNQEIIKEREKVFSK